LVNLNGEVVGINTWIASQSGGSIGLGFAIPVNVARRAINDFIESGEVTYSWLGVQIATPSDVVLEDLGVPNQEGALVTGVFVDSPADRFGLLPGDLITAVEGSAIDSSSSLVRAIAGLSPGEDARIELVRNETREAITVRTARRDSDGSGRGEVRPGLTVRPLTTELREVLDLSAGISGVVVSTVIPDSAAEIGGLRAGDVIERVNGIGIASVGDFYRRINSDSLAELEFRVRRDGENLIVGFVNAHA
jgi:serine protease Do